MWIGLVGLVSAILRSIGTISVLRGCHRPSPDDLMPKSEPEVFKESQSSFAAADPVLSEQNALSDSSDESLLASLVGVQRAILPW